MGALAVGLVEEHEAPSAVNVAVNIADPMNAY